MGTDFDPKPGAVLLTNIGTAPNKPANFSLNTGSVWDLDIASSTLVGGADWVDVNRTASAALNGGVAEHHPRSAATRLRLAIRFESFATCSAV